MIGLIIALVLLGMIFGLGVVLFIVCGADKKHKIVGSLVCVVLWLICAFGMWGSAMIKANDWNNGYCECGEQWQPYGVSESMNGTTTKYYYCPNCYTEIEQ